MTSTGRHLLAGVLACGAALPVQAGPHDAGAGHRERACTQASGGAGGCAAALMLASSAQAAPIVHVPQPAGAPRPEALARSTGIAGLSGAEPSPSAAERGGSLLFWAVGSGLIGFAFAARRRKASLGDS